MVTHAFNIKNSMTMLVQKSQDHKKVKDTSQSLKSMITTSIHKLKIEVKDCELKTKVKAVVLGLDVDRFISSFKRTTAMLEAAAVNLVAGEKPSDVYSEIAAR
ncbi:hypothetical protein Tco_0218693 [Tanacetum coccineum]